MIKLGELQLLQVLRITGSGAFLNDNSHESDDILLPGTQLPKDLEIGEAIEVFVYRDSLDRMIATNKPVKLTLHQLARLTVVDVSAVGVFLDWGLDKDLLLPFAQQNAKLSKGDEVLVALYIDGSDRLCATMKVYDYLVTGSTYKQGDTVKGTVYQFHDRFGAFVAVDDRYHGLIPSKEIFQHVKIGDRVEVRVARLRDDGKLELSLRRQAFQEIDSDGEKIMALLERNDGFLALNDKSDPHLIYDQLQLSKSAFKRAAGHLLKQQWITMNEQGITQIVKEETAEDESSAPLDVAEPK